MKFEEDISKLIPSNENSEIVSRVLQNVNFADKILFNIQSDSQNNLEALQAYTDSVASKFQDDPNVAKLQAKFDENQLMELMDFVSFNLPYYLDETDYLQIDSLLQPDSVSKKLEEAYSNILSPSGFVTTQMIREDPFGINFLGLKKFQHLQAADGFTIENGYLTHENGKNIFLFLTPKSGANETANNTELVEKMERTIQELNQEFAQQNIHAEFFGSTPVSVANAKRIKSDIILTLSISLILLFALFLYFYRKPHIPLIILVPAIFGSLLGMVVLYFLKGTISAISIGIGSVLLGLTLDYSLHILSHYRSTGDVSKLFRSTVKPLLICAIFTAADFLVLLFLKSDVLKDLGVFAAVSVLGAAVFALIFIPQVYSPNKELQVKQNTLIDRLAAYDFSRNKIFMAISILLILISLFTYRQVGFENDLNKLNYMPEELKTAEKNLDELNNYSAKSIYLASYGKNYDEALEANSELFQNLQQAEKNKEILNFSSIGGILLSEKEQEEKIAKWKAFWNETRIENLRNQLISEGRKYGFKEHTFLPFYAKLEESYHPYNLAENEVLTNLFLNEFVKEENGLVTITSVLKTDQPNLEQLIKKFSSIDNTLVIDRKHLQETFLANLETDFNKLFFISSIVVFLILFLFFRSVELTLITNLPIFAGWFVTLGMMGLFGLDFNAFNIIITTLIFGLGVDYSIFVTRGLIEKYTYGKDEMPAFKSGIIMSALATILCFGVLVFAKHPAIYSISWIPIIGLLVVVLMSFTLQPWLFRFFIQKPQDNGNTPRTIFNILMTFLTFGYFFVVGFILNILAQLLIPIIPISQKKKLQVFHSVMQKYFWGLIHGTPFIPIEEIGKENLDFKTPKIIIANHTSQLDTPTMGMLSKKAIFMVNNRVLQSKFFGKAIQMAGFYTSSEDYETGTKKMEEKIKDGYSIIIFPEGTRSKTSAIQRFHKGAFYLAEQLKLDIQPVLIRGNADLLPKEDNILKTGKMTLGYLPIIRHDDPSFGENYSHRTKRIGQYFKEKFIELKRKTEDENYFKKKLLYNYIYKPRYIQKAVLAEFEQYKSIYHQILSVVPIESKIFHFGSGYGVLDFLLVYDSAKRTVAGWDEDSEKVQIAQNSFTVNRFAIYFVKEVPTYFKQFGHIILQNSKEYDRFKSFCNLEEWEEIFDQKEIKILKRKDARRF